MLTSGLRGVYQAVRRLNAIDVTVLLHADAATISAARQSFNHDPQQMSRLIDAKELATLRVENRIHSMVGSGFADTSFNEAVFHDTSNHDANSINQQRLIGTFDGDRVVSFLWVAMGYVPAGENFSRSRHLGSSLQLPPFTGFVFNAWTDLDHRGQGYIARMLWHLIDGDAFGLHLNDLFATTDWTNRASQRAFQKCGFENIGFLTRLGRGKWQASLVPDIQRRFQNATKTLPPINIAADTPGLRWAW